MKMFMSNSSSIRVSIVDVERESKSSVWISGRRFKKITDYESFHPTFKEAKEHLINVSAKGCSQARRVLEWKEGLLKSANELKDITL